MIDHGANVNQQIGTIRYVTPNLVHLTGRCALSFACSRNVFELEMIKLLLKNGANVHIEDSLGRSPFYYCCCSGTRAAIELLLDAGVDWKRKNSKALTGLY